MQQIANETSLNFVISDSVTGDMSLRLKDVPWDQALDTIMQTKGLARRQQGNVVWIAPAEEITNQERLVLEASRQVSELEPLVSDLIQINYAKAEDIANLLKSVRAIEPSVQQSMFGSVSVAEVQTEENRLLSDRGSVTVDERTNSLLIQDTAQKIREVHAAKGFSRWGHEWRRSRLRGSSSATKAAWSSPIAPEPIPGSRARNRTSAERSVRPAAAGEERCMAIWSDARFRLQDKLR